MSNPALTLDGAERSAPLPPAPAPRRPRRWARWLLAAAVLSVLLLVALGLGLAALVDGARDGLHLSVDDAHGQLSEFGWVEWGVSTGVMMAVGGVLLAVVLGVLALGALLLVGVPLLVGFVLVVVLGSLALSLGVVGLVLLLVTLPLWLPLLLLFKLLA
ncbi:MAG: hypothetical protein ACOVOT_05740 [Rubrivivax sp.]